jgi:hypothetical protein
MKKKYLNISLLFLCVLLTLLISGASTVQAQDEDRDAGAIWTPGACPSSGQQQDKMTFMYGEPVYLSGGNGLNNNTTYHYIVHKTGSGGSVSGQMFEGDVTTNSEGKFCVTLKTFMPGDDVNDGNPIKVSLFRFRNGSWHYVSQDNFKIEGSTLQSSVNVSVGACSWTPAGGSTRQVTFTLSGVSKLTVTRPNGTKFDIYSSQTISLPAGHYTYEWTPSEGYRCVNPNSGSFDVAECPQATATYEKDVCQWDYDNSKSITGVTLYLTNAVFTITGVGTYDTSQHVALDPGDYEYSWTGKPGFAGSGSGNFALLECEPNKGSASISPSACSWDESEGSTFVATITLNNATLTINGVTYDKDGENTVTLSCGTYHYTWKAKLPNIGGGEGDLIVEGCEPATVNVIFGTCDWIEETSLTPVTLDINGATLTLFVDDGGTLTQIDEFGPGSHTISLPMGSYAYSWVANENFTGSGEGTFDTLDCEPGKAGATIILGACTYDNEQSLTLVSIFVNGAVLTIDGQDYFEYAEIKLEPGDYPYSWVAASKEFEGEGKGVLTVGSCDPKSSEDPSPDVAAGGSGPSLIITLTPALLTVAGVAIAWMLIKHRIKSI